MAPNEPRRRKSFSAVWGRACRETSPALPRALPGHDEAPHSAGRRQVAADFAGSSSTAGGDARIQAAAEPPRRSGDPW